MYYFPSFRESTVFDFVEFEIGNKVHTYILIHFEDKYQ